MAFEVTTRRNSPKVDEAKMNQKIKELAYHIWERKGRPAGKDWENWFQAAKQIRAKHK